MEIFATFVRNLNEKYSASDLPSRGISRLADPKMIQHLSGCGPPLTILDEALQQEVAGCTAHVLPVAAFEVELLGWYDMRQGIGMSAL